MAKQSFIPCTMARSIGGGVYFRPVRSWHSGTFAGEKLEAIPGSSDRSGCGRKEGRRFFCDAPLTVTHRFYWHESDPDAVASAFLSYPDAMGSSDEYFWETNACAEDVERFFGDTAEQEMEAAIMAFFASKATGAA